MRKSCFAVLLIAIGLLESQAFARITSLTLYEEWREASIARLAEFFPRPATSPSVKMPVFLPDLARELGVSVPQASMLLTRADRHLSYKHGEKIAAFAGVSPEYLLAADLLDRFATVADLQRVLRDEKPVVTQFFVRMYARRQDELNRRPLGEASTLAALLTQWKREVIARLIRLMPDASGKNLSVATLAETLGVGIVPAGRVARGVRALTYAEAGRIAEKHGVTTEWVLASDLLKAFSSVADIERATVHETGAVRTLVLRLYVDHASKCDRDLSGH